MRRAAIMIIPATSPTPPCKRGRKTEFDGGNWSSASVDEEANDQSSGSASYTGRESADSYPPGKHRHTTYPGGERVHKPHYRMCDRPLDRTHGGLVPLACDYQGCTAVTGGHVPGLAGLSLASVMGPGCCHEEGTTLGHE